MSENVELVESKVFEKLFDATPAVEVVVFAVLDAESERGSCSAADSRASYDDCAAAVVKAGIAGWAGAGA